MNTPHLKFIFTLAALCCSLFVYSQQDTTAPDAEELPYKPIAEFNNDTIAFVEYNFIKRPAKSYAGMTVGGIEKLIALPVKKGLGSIIGNNYTSIHLYIIQAKRKRKEPLYIILYLDTPMAIDVLRAKSEKDEILNDLKISVALTEKRIINSVKEDRKPRKPHPMTDVINKDTEEVKKKLKEKKEAEEQRAE